jgi:hypothetical protein
MKGLTLERFSMRFLPWRVMWIEGDEQDPVLTRYVLLAATLRIVASAPRLPRLTRHHHSQTRANCVLSMTNLDEGLDLGALLDG